MIFPLRLVSDPIVLATFSVILGQCGSLWTNQQQFPLLLFSIFALLMLKPLGTAITVIIFFLTITSYTYSSYLLLVSDFNAAKGVRIIGKADSWLESGRDGELKFELKAYKLEQGMHSLNSLSKVSYQRFKCTIADLPWRNSHYLHFGSKFVAEADIKPIKQDVFGRQLLRRGFQGECKIRYMTTPLENKNYFGIDYLRNRLTKKVNSITSDGEAGGIIKALLLGQRSGLSRGFEKRGQELGISHLFVVSGLHIGILFATVSSLIRTPIAFLSSRYSLFWLPKFTSSIAGLSIVWIYILILGMPLSAVRAGIALTITFSIPIILGASFTFFRSIIFSILVLCSVWPLVFEELGFQLTYAALIGLLISAKTLEVLSESFGKNSIKLFILKLFLYAFIPSLFTGLVLLFTKGEFASLATIGNLLVAPIILFIGFNGSLLILTLSLISTSAAKFLMFYIELTLNYLNHIITVLDVNGWLNLGTQFANYILISMFILFVFLLTLKLKNLNSHIFRGGVRAGKVNFN